MEFHPIFVKRSYDDQKKSLLEIFQSNLGVTASQVKRQWIDFLEMMVESVGWRAFWKIPRKTCSIYNIPFPSTVVALVDCVHFESLTADITITDVEGDLNLSESFSDVSLLNLFPTTEQDNKFIDIKNTAEALHDFRFFFNNLWYPWDEMEENENWVNDHFENRLNLFFQTSSGKISRHINQKIQDLISEGHHIFNKLKELELQMSEDQLNPRVLTSGPLCLKMDYISQQLTFFENEETWSLMNDSMKDVTNLPCTSLVWLGGSPADLLSVMNKVHKSLQANTNFTFKSCNSLQKVLKEVSPKDQILLSEGVHYLKSYNVLPFDGGSIQGLENNPETVKVMDSEEGLCLLDIVNKECTIRNVELIGSKVRYILVIRFGRCHLSNVRVKGSSETVGIFLHQGVELIAENCQFVNCRIAVQSEHSTIFLKNCTFLENKSCIEYEAGHVSLDTCELVKNDNGIVERTTMITKINPPLLNEKKCNAVTDLEGLEVENVSFNGNKCNFRKEC